MSHVLDIVFALDETSGLRLTLQAIGLNEIHDLLTLSENDVYALSYIAPDPDTGVYTTLGPSLYEKSLVLSLTGFAVFQGSRLGRALTPSDWFLVTQDEFDDYQGSTACITFMATLPPVVDNTTKGYVSKTVEIPYVPEDVAHKCCDKRGTCSFPAYNEIWDSKAAQPQNPAPHYKYLCLDECSNFSPCDSGNREKVSTPVSSRALEH